MGRLVQVMFLGGTLFFFLTYICVCFVMLGLGNGEYRRNKVPAPLIFGCAYGYSLHLPTYSLCALGSGHAEFSASPEYRICSPPLSIPLSPV